MNGNPTPLRNYPSLAQMPSGFPRENKNIPFWLVELKGIGTLSPKKKRKLGNRAGICRGITTSWFLNGGAKWILSIDSTTGLVKHCQLVRAQTVKRFLCGRLAGIQQKRPRARFGGCRFPRKRFGSLDLVLSIPGKNSDNYPCADSGTHWNLLLQVELTTSDMGSRRTLSVPRIGPKVQTFIPTWSLHDPVKTRSMTPLFRVMTNHF